MTWRFYHEMRIAINVAVLVVIVVVIIALIVAVAFVVAVVIAVIVIVVIVVIVIAGPVVIVIGGRASGLSIVVISNCSKMMMISKGAGDQK